MTSQTDRNRAGERWGVLLILVAAVALLVTGAWTLPAIHAAEEAAALPLPAESETEEQLARAGEDRAKRAELRAFYTAPPVIPHPIMNQMQSTECQHCHAEVRNIGDRTSLVTPHPTFSNCFQCHVASEALDGEPVEPVETTWEGLEAPPPNQQAHTLAPPMVPHRTFLRDDCLTCHNLKTPYESLRCDHPERRNCQGCHVTDAKYNF